MNTLEETPMRIEQEIKKNTMKERLNCIKENITIEPIVACYVIPMMIVRLASSNLNLDKACRVSMAYGDKICDALITKKGEMYLIEETAVQKIIAKVESWRNIYLNAIPMSLILFLGAWSDRTGNRKLCILLPLFGELIGCLINMLNVYFFFEWPVELPMYIQAIFPAMTGSWVTIYMGAYAYVTNITSEETRMYRLTIVNLCIITGGSIGYVLAGTLLDKTGYYGAFLVSSAIFVFGILYGCLFVKDPESSKIKNRKMSSSIWSSIKFFFHISHVRDTIKVALKNEPKGRRIKSILILISIIFIIGPDDAQCQEQVYNSLDSPEGQKRLYRMAKAREQKTRDVSLMKCIKSEKGEDVVKYMFTRFCFNWDAQMFGLYNFFYVGIHTLGAMISVIWFINHLKWDDSVLGIISTTSKIIGSIAIAFATSTKDMYIALVLETLNATAYTVLRSILSKLCSNDEVGKITSLYNLIEMAGSMTFTSMYSTIYLHTISIDPRVIFYASAIFTVLPLVVCGWFYVQHRKALREYKRSYIEEFVDAS